MRMRNAGSVENVWNGRIRSGGGGRVVTQPDNNLLLKSLVCYTNNVFNEISFTKILDFALFYGVEI